MTEDILFDNLYIGHSPEDAKKLAEETFEVKKRVEAEAQKAEAKAEAGEAGDIQTVFKEDPVGFIREKVLEFVELAKIDPIFAAKAKPEVAGGLGLVVLFFIGALFSLVSGGSPPKPAAVSLTFVYHSLSPPSAKYSSSPISHPRKPILPHPTTKPKPRQLPFQRLARTRRLTLL